MMFVIYPKELYGGKCMVMFGAICIVPRCSNVSGWRMPVNTCPGGQWRRLLITGDDCTAHTTGILYATVNFPRAKRTVSSKDGLQKFALCITRLEKHFVAERLCLFRKITFAACVLTLLKWYQKLDLKTRFIFLLVLLICIFNVTTSFK